MITAFNHTARTSRFGSGATILRARAGEFLDETQIANAAPSIFASGAHESRSDRFTHIPTIEVLRGMFKEGFAITEVRQGGSRDEAKRGFTKHLIRMRHASSIGQALVGGDSVRELILVNAHDGTSSYQLMSGLFRMVCTNGLITCEGGEMQRLPHKGDIVGNVIEGAYTIIENSREIGHKVESMQALHLNHGEQVAFASDALALRFNEKDENGQRKEAPIAPEALLRPVRSADLGNDLWRTFNRVQEHVIQGGNSYHHRSAATRRVSRRETRPVNSIDGNVTINRTLWVLAAEMQKLKMAA